MKKINIISLLVAAIVFIIYFLSYSSVLGDVGYFIVLATLFLFGWFDDNGYGIVFGLDNPGFNLVIIAIMSIVFYLISLICLSFFRFIYIKTKRLFSKQ